MVVVVFRYGGNSIRFSEIFVSPKEGNECTQGLALLTQRGTGDNLSKH